MVNDQINVVSSGTSLYCFIRHIYSGPKENGFNVRLDFQRLPEKGELRPYPCTAGPPARPAAGPGPWPLAARGLPLPLELWGRQLGGCLATAKSFVSAGAAPRGEVRPPRARRHTGSAQVHHSPLRPGSPPTEMGAPTRPRARKWERKQQSAATLAA